MGGIRRGLLVLAGVAVVAQAVVLCGMTGWRALTRYESADVERMNADQRLWDVFEAAGAETGPRMGRLENRFTLGWLPSGLGAEGVSVATLAVPGFGAVLIGLSPGRGRKTDRRGDPT
ncbi:MAG TPA: hypothetical protein VD963_03770 [Phycisphaerales bacterium]|nr:hypothetical protein [Phycisphaerales bacterium]